MTEQRKHLARELFELGPNGRTVLRCRCGEWSADRTQTIRNQRLAHRAHRVEMGETVMPLKPTVAERLKAAEAALARVREVAEDIGNWGWPNAQAREYSAALLAALDGDTPKETT